MTREEIMARCEELDPIWQAMKAGKKFKHMPTCHTGFIDEIDLHTGNGVVHFQSYGWFDADEVKPITPVLRVKQPVALMQALVDGGYVCDENGKWTHKTKMYFLPKMWQFCGQSFTTHTGFEWRPEWLEEVNE